MYSSDDMTKKPETMDEMKLRYSASFFIVSLSSHVSWVDGKQGRDWMRKVLPFLWDQFPGHLRN